MADDAQTTSGTELRITMVITELDPGGAENAFARLAIGLSRRGWAVLVVSLRDAGPVARQLQESGIPVEALNCGGLADVRCCWRLYRLLRREQPTHLLTFLHQANLYGRLAAWLTGVNRVICGIRVADRRRLVTWPERLTRRLVDHYVACSRAVGRTHARVCGIPAARISAILNGVEPPSAPSATHTSTIDRDRLAIPEDACVLLFVGRIAEQKGLSDLLEALAVARAKCSRPFSLLVVGDGPERRQEEERVAQLQLGDSCHFLGRVEDPWPYYRFADALVLPSRWEGTPNALLESLSVGTPAIAAAVDGVVEIADRYPGVQLHTPHNIGELAAQIMRFAMDPDPLRTAARKSQPVICKSLTWDAMIHAYDCTLRALAPAAAAEERVEDSETKI